MFAGQKQNNKQKNELKNKDLQRPKHSNKSNLETETTKQQEGNNSKQ